MEFSHLFSYSWLLVLLAPVLIVAFSQMKVSWVTLHKFLVGALFLALVNWAGLVSGLVQSSSLVSILQITPLTSSLLLLVLFLSVVIVRYSLSLLEGDKQQDRFLRWILLVVFAVMLTVSSNHLIMFFLAWVGISLSLHQLLMFYPERPRAALAAHKKFILARFAETLLAIAFILLYSQHQTFFISDILAYYPAEILSWKAQLAACLLAVVALIKCAQLPVHGWLIQVVEAPTPVSALLHAGVINMGGFLLLAFAPLFSAVAVAQWLVLVVAGISTVLAALIMMTRISIKVRLAWSTTTQMGLMLVECALGLYELALLHLLAHSCYKAHAFLNAGETVNHYLQQQFVSAKRIPLNYLGFASIAVFALILGINQWMEPIELFSPWLFIAVALITLFANRLNVEGASLKVACVAMAHVAVLLLSYLVLKTAMAGLLPDISVQSVWLADAWISTLLLVLVVVSLVLQYLPEKPYSQRLFIALNAGLYLDEAMTRFTLMIWPKRLPRTNPKACHAQLEVM